MRFRRERLMTAGALRQFACLVATERSSPPEIGPPPRCCVAWMGLSPGWPHTATARPFDRQVRLWKYDRGTAEWRVEFAESAQRVRCVVLSSIRALPKVGLRRVRGFEAVGTESRRSLSRGSFNHPARCRSTAVQLRRVPAHRRIGSLGEYVVRVPVPSRGGCVPEPRTALPVGIGPGSLL